MSEINIDASEVQRDRYAKPTKSVWWKMSNGCICCTLREDCCWSSAPGRRGPL